MRYCLGIDTSNYTTSVALCDVDNLSVKRSEKKLLEVKTGTTGLRQSDAVFQHVKSLPQLVKEVADDIEPDDEIVCVSVSECPSEQEGSYMPCFLSGMLAASVAADLLKVKKFNFSHQAGHIAAAVFSAERPELLHKNFLGFHVSGGTTQALLVRPHNNKIFDIQCVGGTSDLKAGQAVDRIGGMMGLAFPAGAELERLAANSSKIYNPRVTVKNGSFSISGLENLARRMIDSGEAMCDVARFTLDYLRVAISSCVSDLIAANGQMPVVFAGGVMSNKIIRAQLETQFDSAFAAPEFSSDNAAGVALLGALCFVRGE